MYRIGQGYDVHPLITGRKLILCGEEIDYAKGLDGHSDADVAVHALMDAMLGALAMGDIGKLFPDSEQSYKDADSMSLLKKVYDMILRDWSIVNLDLTIIAEAPKLAPYIEAMRKKLAMTLEIKLGQVSIKATTTEKLGAIGRGEGIAAQAVILLGARPRGFSNADQVAARIGRDLQD